MASNEVRIRVIADTGDASKQLSNLTKNTGGLNTSLGATAKKMALVGTGVAAAAGGIGLLATKTFGAASDLELLNSKITNVFGDSVGIINEWSDNLSVRLGMTNTQLAGAAASFGDVLVPMGFTQEAAANMSTEVIGLSGALSEWSGGTKSVADVSEILTKAMTGEVEGLKSLGVVLSAARIETEMLALSEAGMAGATEQQTKALAIQSLVMKDTEAARQAFASNNDGLVVAQNALSSALGTVKEEILIGLTPTFKELAGVLQTEVVPFITEQFIPAIQEHLPSAIETAKEVFGTLTSVIKLLLPVMGMVHDHAMRIIQGIGFLADKVNSVIDVFKRQREENSKVVDVYNATEEQLDKMFDAYERLGGAISDVTKQSIKNAAQLNTEEEIQKEVTKFKGMATEQTVKSVEAMTEATTKTANLNTETKKLNDTLTATSLAQGLIAQGFFDMDMAAQEATLKQVADQLFEAQRAGSQVSQLAKSIEALLPSNRFRRDDPIGLGPAPEISGPLSGFEGLNRQNLIGAVSGDGPNLFGFNLSSGVGALKSGFGGGIGGTSTGIMEAFQNAQSAFGFDINTAAGAKQARAVANTLGAQAIQQNFDIKIEVSDVNDPVAIGDRIVALIQQSSQAKATPVNTVFGAAQ
jgi:hypothetical protein